MSLGGRSGRQDEAKLRWVAARLRLPLLYKILIANSAIVGLGAGMGTMAVAAWLRVDPHRPTLTLVCMLGIAGTVLSVAVNLLILRVALTPLRELERTARRVDAGDFSARARPSILADRDFARLTRITNQMLDRVRLYRSRIQRLAASALRAGEEERKRISWELHDDAAQRLATLMVRLRTVVRDVDDPEAVGKLEGFREELGDTLESILGYARGLRPPALDDLGLVHAIEGLARQAADRGVAVTVTAHTVPPDLGEDIELALYRMVQEALTNVAKHSGATEAEVEMRTEGDSMKVLIRDPGRGFEAERERDSGTGLGLFGLRERAEYVGGSLDIVSGVGQGTTVIIEIPLADVPVGCA
jgi:two-component system sensor histidine kinase UhpB